MLCRVVVIFFAVAPVVSGYLHPRLRPSVTSRSCILMKEVGPPSSDPVAPAASAASLAPVVLSGTLGFVSAYNLAKQSTLNDLSTYGFNQPAAGGGGGLALLATAVLAFAAGAVISALFAEASSQDSSLQGQITETQSVLEMSEKQLALLMEELGSVSQKASPSDPSAVNEVLQSIRDGYESKAVRLRKDLEALQMRYDKELQEVQEYADTSAASLKSLEKQLKELAAVKTDAAERIATLEEEVVSKDQQIQAVQKRLEEEGSIQEEKIRDKLYEIIQLKEQLAQMKSEAVGDQSLAAPKPSRLKWVKKWFTSNKKKDEAPTTVS